jgi:outer membrane protein OmpA-like peptidoglycan-associated protein
MRARPPILLFAGAAMVMAMKMPPIPAVPAAPPAAAVIPPPDLAPPHPTTPPPLPPESGTAAGAATPIADGISIGFGADDSTLNPATEAALRDIAKRGVADQTITYTLDAHAPGSPEDQSTPRRLSLARGLAVRSILINAGIPSTRIYVHALGTIRLGKTEPDRVDVTLTTIGGAPRAKPKPATP